MLTVHQPKVGKRQYLSHVKFKNNSDNSGVPECCSIYFTIEHFDQARLKLTPFQMSRLGAHFILVKTNSSLNGEHHR